MPRKIESGGAYNIVCMVRDDCEICVALGDEWDQDRDRDVILEIQNHPHLSPKLARVKLWKVEGAPKPKKAGARR